MRKSNIWRYFFGEAFGLLLLSVLLAVAANHLRSNSLPLFSVPVDPSTAEHDGSKDVATVTPVQAMEMALEGGVIFVDVRSALEYSDGHVSGALSIPYTEAKERSEALRIIAYCSGPECGMAENFAALAAKDGIRVQVMPQGISGWFASGGLLEAGQ